VLVDLRLSKSLTFGSTRFQVMGDIYNLLNSDATIGQVQAVGPSLGSPRKWSRGVSCGSGFSGTSEV
jgi:hypothetical protein